MAEGFTQVLTDAGGEAAKLELASNVFLPADVLLWGTVGITTLGAAMWLISSFTRGVGRVASSAGSAIGSIGKRAE